MSMATTLPSDVMRSQMRRKAHTLFGHGANINTVVSESALASANLTRTPSTTRKYVDICDPVPVLIRGFLLHSLSDRSVWQAKQTCLSSQASLRGSGPPIPNGCDQDPCRLSALPAVPGPDRTRAGPAKIAERFPSNRPVCKFEA